jgi:hypothetical protein
MEKNRAIGRLVRILKRIRKGDEKARTEFVGALASLANLGIPGINPSEVGVYKAEGVPGPEGMPEGSTSKHADGTIWEKRADGWHQIGSESSGGRRKKQEATDDEHHKRMIAHQQSLQVLQRLRERLKVTNSPEEREAISKQIAAIRNKIAILAPNEMVGEENKEQVPKEREVEKSLLVDFEKSMTSRLQEMASKSSAMSVAAFVSEVMLRGDEIAKAQLRYLYRHGAESAAAKIKEWLR